MPYTSTAVAVCVPLLAMMKFVMKYSHLVTCQYVVRDSLTALL